MSDDFQKTLLRALKKSSKRAFETAVRTGTSLIFEEHGKIIKAKPPYRYKLVKVKRKKRSA
jgi:hypothetical protein